MLAVRWRDKCRPQFPVCVSQFLVAMPAKARAPAPMKAARRDPYNKLSDEEPGCSKHSVSTKNRPRKRTPPTAALVQRSLSGADRRRL